MSSCSVIIKVGCPLPPMHTRGVRRADSSVRRALTLLTHLILLNKVNIFFSHFTDGEARPQAMKELSQGHPTSSGQAGSPAQEPARKGLEAPLLAQERVPAQEWPACPKGKSGCHVRALGTRWVRGKMLQVGTKNISPPSMEESLAHVGQNITPLPGRRHSSPERVTLPKSTGASGGHTGMKVREDGATLKHRESHTVSSVKG